MSFVVRTTNSQFPEISFVFTYTLTQEVSCLSFFAMPVQSSKYITSAFSPGQGSSRRKIFNMKSMELHQSYARRRATFQVSDFCHNCFLLKTMSLKLELILIIFFVWLVGVFVGFFCLQCFLYQGNVITVCVPLPINFSEIVL